MGTWQIILNTHWLWTTLAWVLPFLAAAVLLWALFRDRPGLWGVPRERCPKCRYDMAGHHNSESPIECPECGKAIGDARSLRKTRRRWGVALLAVPLLVGWYLAMHKDAIRASGWLAAVPTPVLMVVVDPQDWFALTTNSGQHSRPATPPEFLHRGLLRHDLLMRVWLWRVGGLLRDEGIRVVDATSVAPITDPDPRLNTVFYLGGQYPPPPRGLNDRDAEFLTHLVRESIDPVGWIEQGGEWYTLRRAGSFLLPEATPNVVDAIEELVLLLEVAGREPESPHSGRIHGTGFMVVSMDYFRGTPWFGAMHEEAIDFAIHAEITPIAGGSIYRSKARGNIIDPLRYADATARHRAEELIRDSLMLETGRDNWVDYGGELYMSTWIGEVLVVHSAFLSRDEFYHQLERIRDLGPDAILKEHGVQP